MKSHAGSDPQSSTPSSTREQSCWVWSWCQVSKQLGCSLFSPCCVRKGHAAFAMLGWVPIFKIFSGLLRNLSLAPSVIGRDFTTSLSLLPCTQMVPVLSTKKGTLTPSLLALVFSRFQCLFSVSEVSSAFFPGQKQDVGCARRHLWVSCIPFFFSAVWQAIFWVLMDHQWSVSHQLGESEAENIIYESVSHNPIPFVPVLMSISIMNSKTPHPASKLWTVMLLAGGTSHYSEEAENMAAELKPLGLAGAFLLCTYSRRTWVCRAPRFPAEKYLPQSFSFSQYTASALPSLQKISFQQLFSWTLYLALFPVLSGQPHW